MRIIVSPQDHSIRVLETSHPVMPCSWHMKQWTSQNLELRDADGPEDIRGYRRSRSMCEVCSQKKLGEFICAFSLANWIGHELGQCERITLTTLLVCVWI